MELSRPLPSDVDLKDYSRRLPEASSTLISPPTALRLQIVLSLNRLAEPSSCVTSNFNQQLFIASSNRENLWEYGWTRTRFASASHLRHYIQVIISLEAYSTFGSYSLIISSLPAPVNRRPLRLQDVIVQRLRYYCTHGLRDAPLYR